MSKKSLDPKSSSHTGEPPIRGSIPSAPGDELLLPHERDEFTRNVAETPDPVIEQAKRDIDAGLVDTDMRATAGPNADLRERLVPGPGGKPPFMASSQNPKKTVKKVAHGVSRQAKR